MRIGRPLDGRARAREMRAATRAASRAPVGGVTGDQTLVGVEDVILMGNQTNGILMGDGVSYIRMGF